MADDTFYKNLLDNLYDGVYFVDVNRKITYWNSSANRISGYSGEEMVGHFCFNNILNHVDQNGKCLCTDGCPLQRTITDGSPQENMVFLRHKDGHRVPVNVRTSPIRNRDGEITGAVEVFSDHTEYQHTVTRMNQLEVEVHRDALTGLFNRAYLEKQLVSSINDFEYFNIPFGLLFLDIDHFKNVNDTYGHATGDEVLKMLSHTLKHNLRDSDIVARWGGEEFVVLIKNVDKYILVSIAEKLRNLIEKSMIKVEDKFLSVTVSIGATLYRAGETDQSILSRADQALYNSKRTGRNKLTADFAD